jgi:hypothetical protein
MGNNVTSVPVKKLFEIANNAVLVGVLPKVNHGSWTFARYRDFIIAAHPDYCPRIINLNGHIEVLSCIGGLE